MAKEISVISAQDFLKCCRAGTLCGAYLLFGDEEYMKRSCVEASRKALLEEGTEAFNQTTINAVEDKAWADTLAEAVTSLPVFAEKRLCELHSLDYNKLSENQLSDLGTILAFLPDNEQSVVVMDALAEEFDAGRLPKAPSKQFRALSPYVTFVSCERESGSKLGVWVTRHFASNGVEADRDTVNDLIAYCSTDMYALASEIDKLSFYTLSQGRTAVDRADIRKVCSSASLTGAFDFSNAILDGDLKRATELLHSMKARREKPEFILSGITEAFSLMYSCALLQDAGKTKTEIASALKIHEYRAGLYMKSASARGKKRLRASLRACLDADVRIKSTPADSYTVLDRLVIELCM